MTCKFPVRLSCVVFWTALVSAVLPASGHIPHDDTRDIAVAGNVAFVAVRQEFYLSRDSGLTWTRKTRGIVCDDRGIRGDDVSHGAHGRTVALSPGFAADGTAYVTCAGGMFRSDDGAARFARVPLPTAAPIADLLLAPDFQTSGHVLVRDHTGVVFRSPDRGDSWQTVPGPVSALRWTAEGLVASTAAGMVHVSGDAGETWVQRADTGSTATDILPVGTDILLATGDGVQRIAADGTVQPAGLAGRNVSGLSRVAADGVILAATWRRGVHASPDGGMTWTPVTQGLQTVPQAVAYDTPDFRHAAALDDGTVLLGGFDGLYRTTDVFGHWARLDMTVGHIVALDAVTGRDGHRHLGVVPYVNGIALSADAGQGWDFAYEGLDARGTALAVTPTYPEDRQMFTGNRRTLSARDAAAARWRTDLLEQIADLELGREAPTVLGVLLSPDFETDRTLFVLLAPGGVLRSRDGGETFDVVLRDGGEAYSGIISSDFARDGTLAVTTGGDVRISRDGGDSWQTVRTAPADRLILVQGGGAQPGLGPLFVAARDTLFWSRDGAASWDEIPLPRTGLPAQITALAASPTFADDGRLLLQLKGAPLQVGTRDATGFDWQDADTPPQREVSALTYVDAADLFAFSPDFAADRRVYAGVDAAIMVSDDAGMTWRDLPPLPRRYEAEYALSDIRSIPVTLSGDWALDRPALVRSAAMRDRIRKFIIRTVHWRNIDRIGQSGENALRSQEAGASMRLDFVGTAATVIGPRGPGLGQARVSVNGVEVGVIDQSAPSTEYAQDLYHVDGLPRGLHALEIDADGDAVVIDAFQIVR